MPSRHRATETPRRRPLPPAHVAPRLAAHPATIVRAGAWQAPERLRRYRYRLGFEINAAGRGRIAFIGLNPSTASLTTRDPTVDSFCRAFATQAGYRELEMLNLFALRSTDKAALLAARDPVGPQNDAHLRAATAAADAIVAAWGAHFHPLVAKRARRVLQLLNRPLLAIGHNADGSPAHPLYQNTRRSLRPFDAAGLLVV